jgi:hypothetical protein
VEVFGPLFEDIRKDWPFVMISRHWVIDMALCGSTWRHVSGHVDVTVIRGSVGFLRWPFSIFSYICPASSATTLVGVSWTVHMKYGSNLLSAVGDILANLRAGTAPLELPRRSGDIV